MLTYAAIQACTARTGTRTRTPLASRACKRFKKACKACRSQGWDLEEERHFGAPKTSLAAVIHIWGREAREGRRAEARAGAYREACASV
jgi:hypothetical protein